MTPAPDDPRALGDARTAPRRLLVVFLTLIGALVVLVAAGLVVTEDIDRSTNERIIDEALPRRARVQDLRQHMIEQQSAVRGFILTSDDVHLDIRGRARGAVQADLRFLRRNAGGDPELAALLSQAERQIAQLERFFDAQVERAAAGPVSITEARRLVGRQGEPLFEQFRGTVNLMVARTSSALHAAREQQDRRTRNLRVLLLFVGVGGLGLAGALALVVPRRAGRLLGALEADRAAISRSEVRTRRLQEATAAMAGAPLVADIVDAVLTQGRAATGATAGTVSLLDPGGERFRLAGIVGYAPDVGETFAEYPASAPLPSADAVREGPLWLRSIEELTRRYPHLRDVQGLSGQSAIAAVPLLVDGAPIGALALSFPDARAFPEDERVFVLTLADLCAQALDRARLYEAERRDAERTAFLAEASALLAASLEPDETLRQLTRLAVPRLADWCTVTVPDGAAPRTVAVAHMDPAKVRLAQELVRRYPAPADAPTGAPAVLRTGRSQHIPRIDDATLASVAQDDEHLRLLRGLRLCSAIVVPLVARDRVLGALTLVAAESGRHFSTDDLAFAEDLGRRAALATDNARLYERQREIARTLQRSLLPGRLPVIPGVEVAARYLAAGDGEVGGDFYDLFELEDGQGWAAVLGDVCGKGAEAAGLTALARHTVRAESDLLAPGVVLSRLNAAVIRQRHDGRFLTAGYAWLRGADGGLRVTAASGGHPPALVLRRDGRVDELKPVGPLIGVFPGARFLEEEVTLGPGDALVLYTDGVIEARTPEPDRGFFGLPRLSALLRAHAGSPADVLAEEIQGALERFCGGAATDDVAVLVVRAATVVEGDPALAAGGREPEWMPAGGGPRRSP